MRVVLLAACAVCAARQAEPPLFRATTRLVEFTVVAQNAKSRAVTDLGKEDFVVEEKDKPRAVAFSRFEGARERREVKAPRRACTATAWSRPPGPRAT